MSAIRVIEQEIDQKATTVTTTATAIPATELGGRRTMLVQNRGDSSVYLGASDVTTATGYELASGDAIELVMSDKVTLYGITASGTADIRTIEGY